MSQRSFDPDSIRRFVEQTWDDSIVPTLEDYVRIPNQSPAFDADWQAAGHMDRAVALLEEWLRGRAVRGMHYEVVRLDGRTPVVFIEIPGSTDETVLLYGHLDKQPPLDGWEEGLDPWTPVIRDGKLYGRGAADDGYAAFASITAIEALQKQDTPHARCVVLIECCEESGSYDLPHYVQALKPRIGNPDLVICLDSGCGDYDRLWVTTSLRGVMTGDLTVSTLREGVHSGAASGIVPSSFRVIRKILSRLENVDTGEISDPALNVDIPEDRLRQAAVAAAALGKSAYAEFPFQAGASPVDGDIETLLLNRTWRPQLEIVGAAGLPRLEEAGNVLRASTTLKLSVRLPPTADPARAGRAIKDCLESDPPYGAKVEFVGEGFAAAGWNSPAIAPWLHTSLERASQDFFGKGICYMGEGGTIPFMSMLGEMFPDAQFVITGVLGPRSNAHGPNEFLEIATGKRLTSCVARVLADHAARK